MALPFLLRSWARAEASHHDTLDCRNVLQTYLIAGFGWTCAVLAAAAGKPVSAVGLQVRHQIFSLFSCFRFLWVALLPARVRTSVLALVPVCLSVAGFRVPLMFAAQRTFT